MQYYSGKTIWITGASSGIGAHLAKALSKYASRIIVSSRKKEELQAVATQCHSSCEVLVLPLDLEQHEALDSIFERYRAVLKEVDILINNGGISQRSRVDDTQFSVYKRLIDVNYLGNIKLTLFLLPYFKKRNKGHIVVTSSVAGKFGVPGRSGYSASKMALHGFYDAMRAELISTDIKISLICPGYIKTNISYNALEADGKAHGVLDDGQANGMGIEEFTQKAIKAIAARKEEVLIGGFRETIYAVTAARLFPSIFKKIIARSKVN